jgi:hypothetical protein
MVSSAVPPQYKGDPYYAQQYLRTSIDIIRESILRDNTTRDTTGVEFTQIIQNKIGAETYFAVVTTEDLLVNYITELTGKQQDDLYRIAYTEVCTHYGGIVYEDTFKYQPQFSGRARFQCGWSQSNCRIWSDTWSKQFDESSTGVLGSYAEWYDLVDVQNKIISNYVLTDNPDVDATTLLDITGTVNAYQTKNACLITNAGVRSLCTEFKGTYNYSQHACVFTPEYCQSIGTCYNQSSKTCTLEPIQEVLDGLSMFFGSGGPRDWIRHNGCKFPSDPLDAGAMLTTTGYYIIADEIAKYIALSMAAGRTKPLL